MKTIFANAIASEIENNVTRYEFATEAETEAAVLECIGNGIKFNTVGRCALVVYQPAPETTEPTNNTPATMNANEPTLTTESAAAYNAMLNPSEEPASLAWESETKTDEELTALGVDAFGGNEGANGTTEFCELTHAGQCLDIYLNNTAEIYNRYTVPAINAVVDAKRYDEAQPARVDDTTAWGNLTFWISWQQVVKNALKAAARLVKKCDHMTPTAQDIEQVTRNYAAYIVDCAKYEIEK